MPLSDEEFEAKFDELLPKKLAELGYIHTSDELLTKNDFKLFIEDQNRRWEREDKRWEEQNEKWAPQNEKWEEQGKNFKFMLQELIELRIGFGTIGN